MYPWRSDRSRDCLLARLIRLQLEQDTVERNADEREETGLEKRPCRQAAAYGSA